MQTSRRVWSRRGSVLGAALVGLIAAGPQGEATRSVEGMESLEEIHGTVVDPSGNGVAQALVALFEGDRRLLQVTADRNGNFRMTVPLALRTPPRRDGVALHVERVGFEELRRERILQESLPIRIELLYAPLPLPGLTAEVDLLACGEIEDDPEARRLWLTAASLHPGGLDTLGIAAYTLSRTDTLPSASVVSEPDRVQLESGQRGSAPIRRASWNRTLDRQGYAFSVRRATREGSFSSWSYAPLEADFAFHFGDDGFGRRHVFRASEGPDAGWVLRFCPRDSRRPHIEGWIEVGADTLIRRAEWRFVTPEPDEQAGGWVRFPSPESGESPFLLPEESMTWATIGGRHTVRRAHWYEGWVLAEGDSVPFLPRR